MFGTISRSVLKCRTLSAVVAVRVSSKCSQQVLRDVDVAAAQPFRPDPGLGVEARLIGDSASRMSSMTKLDRLQVRRQVTGDGEILLSPGQQFA